MDFFFFKQKTAYDMRISDWSSDVCSSDLRIGPCAHGCASGARVYDRGADIADVPDFLTISKDQRFQRCFRCAIGPPVGAGILSNAGSEGDKMRILTLSQQGIESRDQRLLSGQVERDEADRKSTRLNSSH